MSLRAWPAFTLVLLIALALGACASGDDDDADDDDDSVDDDDSGGGDDTDDPPDVDDDQRPYDYMIVAADPELERAVQELKGLRHAEGLSVFSTNLNELGLAAADDETKVRAVRALLAAEYDPARVQYVLLVGSHATLPMCIAYLDPSDHELYGEYTTPTDYCYGDVTANWDADDDGWPGEYPDDALDFSTELYVGRLPLDEPEDVRRAAGRIVDFAGDNSSYKDATLLAAGRIRYEGDASLIMELIRTQTLRPAGFEVTRAYADDNVAAPELPLEHAAFVNYWSANDLGFVMWACHGSARGAFPSSGGDAFITADDAMDVAASAPSVVFSSACSNADAFEFSLGHALLAYKAPAFIGSTQTTHPGDLGEGALTFLVTIEDFMVSGLPLGRSFSHGIDYYMEHFFLRMGYEPQLYLRNIYGFNVYGDPALVYQP